MTPEMLTAILGVGGLAAILPKIIDGLNAWRSGRAVAEKGNNRTILERLTMAERRAETEAEFRRLLEDYASTLRVMLIGAGIPADKIPAWPTRIKQEIEKGNGSGPFV
jgi:hypothetical protein